nr:pentatricopeptide repeat-containing protein, mitochondrial [Quercus suber]
MHCSVFENQIPESISKFTRLKTLEIKSCKYLPEIPRLPQSIREVFILNSQLLHPQSSNRLLSQFGELWYPESEISLSPQIPRNVLHCELILPGSEISKWFNHRSVGNSISFWIRRGSPTFCCCVVFESGEQSGEYYLDVIFKFNGTRHRIFQGIWVADMMCNHVLFFHVPYEQASGLLYCSSQCYDHYQNHVEACCELRNINEGRKVNCEIIKVGSPDSFVLTALVDMYAKCGENNCLEEALVLFNRMRKGLVEGNEFTLGSLVNACTKLRALHQGKWAHGYVIKNSIEFNSFLATELLDMYVKYGDVRDAHSIFGELSVIDLVSRTAMIVGCTQCGHPSEAIKLFMDEEWDDILPNLVTASSVLSACGQLGNLDLVRSVHDLGIKLGLGLILEKWQSVKCYYILMKLVTMYSCNLYASDGRWSQVKQVRELMKQRGLRKSPGRSQVEMDISDDISLPKVALLW